jgi:hypothetical protein
VSAAALLTWRGPGTCWDFARHAWRVITGGDLGEQPGYLERPPQFERVESPASPCVVLMTSPAGRLHVGVYWRGRVWHLRPHGAPHGASLDRLREHGAQEYYACKPQ